MYSVEYDWLIAVGILIGVSLFLTMISDDSFDTDVFFIYMCIVNAFIVSADLFPMWTQVLLLLVVVGLAIIKLRQNQYNGGIE
jgi:hypothetical protein